MKLSFIEPRIELKPYIQSIWVFESQVGLPVSDISLAAPNGCPKLIVNCENSLISTAQGRAHVSPEQSLSFVGIRDVPVVLSTTARKTCFIGIEFSPSGAFPVFGVPMGELANRLVPVDVLSRTWNQSCLETVRNLEGTRGKVDFIQERLFEGLKRRASKNTKSIDMESRDPIVEYCVDLLRRTHGKASISDLERRTGYERRFLEILFKRSVGVSPKTLAGIFRFQWFYKKIAHTMSYEALKEEMYQYFYDQAHFTRDFKRMTGFPPKQFLNVSNEFGRQLSLSQ